MNLAPALLQVLAVSLGAMLGALLRWQAGLRLGALPGGLVAGTVAVNLVGGALIGVSMAWFGLHPEQQVQRLFCVVGFLGGLTTFSAFSGESLGLIATGRYGLALAHTLLHVLGSLACAALGHAVGRRLFD